MRPPRAASRHTHTPEPPEGLTRGNTRGGLGEAAPFAPSSRWARRRRTPPPSSARQRRPWCRSGQRGPHGLRRRGRLGHRLRLAHGLSNDEHKLAESGWGFCSPLRGEVQRPATPCEQMRYPGGNAKHKRSPQPIIDNASALPLNMARQIGRGNPPASNSEIAWEPRGPSPQQPPARNDAEHGHARPTDRERLQSRSGTIRT